jgi:hypothetical protein
MFGTIIHPLRVTHRTKSPLACLAILGLGFSMLIGMAGTAMAAPTPAPAVISPEKCREGDGVVKKTPYAFTCQGGKYNGADVEY